MQELTPRIVIAVLMLANGGAFCWAAFAAAAGRLRRKHIMGINTRNTVVSDEAWVAGHVRAKSVTLLAAVVSILGGVGALLPFVPLWGVVWGAVALSLVVIALFFWSARVANLAAAQVASPGEGNVGGTGEPAPTELTVEIPSDGLSGPSHWTHLDPERGRGR